MLSSKFRIISVVFICALIFALLDAQSVQADPFISYPGTRAKAMGSTFTAIANDMSAVWYNPAGIAMGKEAFDGTAEWSQAVAYDTDEYEFKGDEDKFFVGGAWSGEKWGSGLYYLSPYSLNWDFTSQGEGSAYGNLKEDMEFLGFVLARSFWHNRLKLGATLDYTIIKINKDKSQIRYDIKGNGEAELVNDAEFGGISSNLGAKFTAVDYRPWALQVDLGGVYRFPSAVSLTTDEYKLSDEWSDVDENFADALEELVLEKPSSYALGAAVNKGLVSLKSNLILSAQYEETNWSESNEVMQTDYEKTSFGLEWQFLETPVFERISLRTGYYESEPSENGWPTVEGFSQGIGVRIGESLGAEFSAEQRNWSWSVIDDEENFDLYSLSLTYTH